MDVTIRNNVENNTPNNNNNFIPNNSANKFPLY